MSASKLLFVCSLALFLDACSTTKPKASESDSWYAAVFASSERDKVKADELIQNWASIERAIVSWDHEDCWLAISIEDVTRVTAVGPEYDLLLSSRLSREDSLILGVGTCNRSDQSVLWVLERNGGGAYRVATQIVTSG